LLVRAIAIAEARRQ